MERECRMAWGRSSNRRRVLLGVSAFFPLAPAALGAPTPILDYRFDDRGYTFAGATRSGSGAVSVGADVTPVRFRARGGLAPGGDGQSELWGNFLTAADRGVSGRPGDHALQMDANLMG